MKKITVLIKETYKEWSEDKASRLAAALSYYTIFSLAPLLVIVIAIAGLVWGQSAAQGAIVGQIKGLVGQQGATQVQTMIQNAYHPGQGIIATILGLVLLIFGATGVFSALQDSLNTIWDIRLRPGLGFKAMVKERFLSFAMVLGIAFLLLVSLVVTAALSAISRMTVNILPGQQFLMQAVNFLISFLVISLLFVLIFKYLPDAEITRGDTWRGGAITALLFLIGQFAIGLYLGKSNVTSTFGAAGSLILILLWIYYSGMVLFIGAEFTQVYARRYGHGIQPSEIAEFIPAEEGVRPEADKPQPSYGRSQPASPARTAVPSVTGMPVTGDAPIHGTARDRILESALPAVVAFLVGFSGSIAIAREQRNRPIVKK